MPETSAPERAAHAARMRLAHVNLSGQQLADSIQAWMATDPIGGVTRVSDDRLSWELRWSVALPQFDSWGLMFGDAVHNLRSMLDNFVYLIAESEGASAKELKNVQFPVESDSERWAKVAKQRISMLPARVQNAIESVQPFQRPESEQQSDGLAILSSFNNGDKHRIAIVDSIAPRTVEHEFQVQFEDGATVDGPPRTEFFAGPFEDGALALRHETAPDRIKSVSGSGKFEALVVIADEWGNQHGITSVLAGLATYVPMVLDVVLVAWTAPEVDVRAGGARLT